MLRIIVLALVAVATLLMGCGLGGEQAPKAAEATLWGHQT